MGVGSFLSLLGGIAGAPFTGGASLIPGLIGVGGDILGGIEQGRQQGRYTDAQMNLLQDRNKMDAARLNLQAPRLRAGNAVQGDILANAKNFAYGAPRMVGNIPVPTSTGGLRPDIFSPATRQLGSLQSAQALASGQANGGNVADVTPLPQATGFDKFLQIAAPIASGVGSLSSMIPYKKPKTLFDPSMDPSAGSYAGMFSGGGGG